MSAETEKTYGEDIPESFEYVYLIHPAEYVTKNEPVYKFGKTGNIEGRFFGYSQNSVIYYICRVKNCSSVEKAIDKDFNKHFTLAERKEYFKGRKSEMIKCIESIINKMNQRVIEDGLVDKITKYYGNRHKIMLDDNTDKTDIVYNYDDDEVDEIDFEDNDNAENKGNVENNIKKNCNVIKKKAVKRNVVKGKVIKNNNITVNNVFINNNPNPNPLACEICNKTFKRKQILDKHVENKICVNKPFACDVCGNRFDLMNSVYRHKRGYCEGKPYWLKNDNEENNEENDDVGEVDNDDTKDRIKEIEKMNEILMYERKLIEKAMEQVQYEKTLVKYERELDEKKNKIELEQIEREKKLIKEKRKMIEKEKFRKHILSDRVYGSK